MMLASWLKDRFQYQRISVTFWVINTGDRVTFVVEDGTVRVVNSAIYALQRFQAQMKGEGKAAGLMNDDDVAAWITASRREEESE